MTVAARADFILEKIFLVPCGSKKHSNTKGKVLRRRIALLALAGHACEINLGPARERQVGRRNILAFRNNAEAADLSDY